MDRKNKIGLNEILHSCNWLSKTPTHLSVNQRTQITNINNKYICKQNLF